MIPLRTFYLICFFFSVVHFGYAQINNVHAVPDVLKYEVNIEPEIREQMIKGSVSISFLKTSEAKNVAFDCGNLQVSGVTGEAVKSFDQKNKKLIISISENKTDPYLIHIFYEGNPSRGLIFLPESDAVYTVFSSEEWMICNTDPADRAKIDLNILVPSGKTCIANGDLVRKEPKGEKTLYSWVQDYETPSYTYGFAVGTFNYFQDKHSNVSLDCFSENYSPSELETIFSYTGDMLSFFEEISGVPYVQSSYSQILIGNHYQEMSGFAVLKESYGRLVLKDSTETNLISHELAHQWWGNMVTCRNWNHFWLNEGFATFLSAAYNEHRFGKEKYDSDIESYRKVYQSIKEKGKDKPLVFEDWTNPTSDDRNLVYFKGAYVLHLLRSELGDKEFWKGIKLYTTRYYGKSVVTDDFKNSMEESSGRDLSAFFDEWVY